MPPFRKCLALVNTRSGAREARLVFASALQRYLDCAGILHRDVLLPESDVHHALTAHLPSSDCVIVCGGDGTISRVVNVLASAFVNDGHGRGASAPRPEVEAMLSKPIAIVPAGRQNSVAHSLGVSSAERSVSQFVMGRVDAVPIWEVRLDGKVLRYVCSYVAIGTYACVVERFHWLDKVGDVFMALPSLGRHKFTAAALYSTVVRSEAVPCGAALLRKGGRGSPDSAAPAVCQRYEGPLRMLLAAQMPLQHGGYSLTPRASHRQGRLTVTVATAEASRLRMWHLLRREAIEGEVLEEDGVAVHEAVEGLHITFREDGAAWDGVGRTLQDGNRPCALLMLDGEEVHVPPGSVVTVGRVEGCTIPFLIC